MFNQRAQSTIEYLLIFAVTVLVLAVFLNPKKSVMKSEINETLKSGMNRMSGAANTIFPK
ncbi:MAG: class III signal peptide-containing protein [Candidatus Omnitrophica bacterium]|nr:class III signal peptide-containing protein [Candidatus Omnitrophota bacterium]